MEVRYTTGKNEYRRMTTEELRAAFLNTKLYEKGKVNLMYCEVERGIAGFAVPTTKPLGLPAGKELASDYFCERRELGILNIGGAGTVTVDGKKFELRPLDVLYVGKGAKKVLLASKSAKKPAEFYLASYPAHKEYPTKLIKFEDANHRHLGTVEDCNVRTIHQFILPGKCESCQLVMGFTRLEPELPARDGLHAPRAGQQLEHDAGAHARAAHGDVHVLRHRAGRGGVPLYTFCWAMGGENQVFDDMDGIAISALR